MIGVVGTQERKELSPEEVEGFRMKLIDNLMEAFPQLDQAAVDQYLAVSPEYIEALGEEADLTEYLAKDDNYPSLKEIIGDKAYRLLAANYELSKEEGFDEPSTNSIQRYQANLMRSRALAIILEQEIGTAESKSNMTSIFRHKVIIQMLLQEESSNPEFLLTLTAVERAEIGHYAPESEELRDAFVDLVAAVHAAIGKKSVEFAEERFKESHPLIKEKAVAEARDLVKNIPSTDADTILPNVLAQWGSFSERVL